MSKRAMADDYLNTVLDRLEDTLNTYLAKCNNYQEVQNLLENGDTISTSVMERLLAVCVGDLKQNTQHAASALTVISAVLTKLKSEKYTDTTLPDLVPSALAIVNMLKVISKIKVDTLPMLCYEVLLSFPDNTLVKLVTSHSEEVIDTIGTCACKNVDGTQQGKIIDLVALKLLVKLLNILPHTTKQEFVKQGLNVWLSEIMPNIIAFTKAAGPDVITCIEVLELLTDSLIHIDYADNAHWKIMLECIYNPQKYPALLEALLQCKCDSWYRLWIIFIRLLKKQVTKVSNSSVIPISSILPVVELAFKMDQKIRCQAFQCWNVLIDNFVLDDRPEGMHKRMKLLIIPLKLGNAKLEEVALAKFNTWWHLIRRFHSKMDSYTDMILIPFLHFCFGKVHVSGKVIFSHGQFSDDMRKQYREALVEIAGHVECEGCVTLPKLESRLISAKILVDHWNDWVHSLKNATITAATNCDKLSKQQVTCLWKSFLMTIGEMQENNIRKDLFNELLGVITRLCQTSAKNEKLAEITLHVLFDSLLVNNNKIRQLLKTRGESISPIQQILNIITNPSLNNIFSRMDSRELVTKFKPLTNLIMDGSLQEKPDDIIKSLFKDMQGNDTTLMLWAALAESLFESDHDTKTQNKFSMILWPLRFLNEFSNERSSVAWHNWLTLYNLMHHKLSNTSINHNISKILSALQILNHYTSWEFPLCATLAVLKSKLLQDESKGCEDLTRSLHKILTEVNGYQCIEKVLPILFDTLTLMTDKVVKFLNLNFAIYTIDIVKIVLKLITQILKQNDNAHAALIFTENLIKILESMFKIVEYSVLKQKIVEELIECLSLTDKNSSLHYNILSLLKSFLTGNNKLEQTLYMKTKAAIDADSCEIDNSIQDALCTKPVDSIDNIHIDNIDDLQNNYVEQNSINTFTTPNDKGLRKKMIHKDASIVNTVVENGEEFVVVKSHWKFNPRKLTENQKEKFKRKREDIPALYQDLSQSQDEFKLTAWKSNDSQETTITSSKSTTNSNDVDASVILQNIPSSDVVPNIMESILTHATRDTKLNENTTSDKSMKQQQLVLVKDAKSPRLALKDRVFKNARILMEKSNLQLKDKLKSDTINLTVQENVTKTPPSKTNTTTNIINSAPSKITSDRPSRVIKMPKKFENSELNVFKKRRRSQNDSPLPDFKIPDTAVEKLNIQMKPINSELNVLKKRRLSQSGSPLSDFKKPDEESNMQTKPNNSEPVKLKKRRQSHNNYTQLNLKNADKPVEESNIQTIENKEDAKHPSIMNENSHPLGDDIDLQSTKLINTAVINKVLDTEMKNTETNQIEKKEDLKKETCHNANTKTPRNIILNVVNEIQEDTNSNKEVTEDLLTPQDPPLLNLDLSTANIEKVSHKKKYTETSEPINKETNKKTLSVKKKRSRIEQQLLIDMVEGHPFLQEKSEKQVTKQNVRNVSSGIRTRSIAEKLSRSPSEKKIDKKSKRKESYSSDNTSITVSESQEQLSRSSEDFPMSEDIIESSQDSSITTVSMKSSKQTSKKVLFNKIDNNLKQIDKNVTRTQLLLDELNNDIEPSSNTLSDQDSGEDIELSKNKTRVEDNNECTENMDTEPIDDEEDDSGGIIVVNNDESPILINTEDTCIELDTQEIADADTQPLDTMNETMLPVVKKGTDSSIVEETSAVTNETEYGTKIPASSECLELSATVITVSSGSCSPLKDEVQRKKDFLNNTIEISPIKTMSPERQNKSPSPETSSDYVVIKLTSPVQSNGEPFDKCDSPEIFTDDKVSPNKRDQSPPRVVVSVQNTSPSSSLSLKKNKPQIRPNGRGAHMLGLCAPDQLQAIMNSERSVESDESKKRVNLNTPARRNLRILYSSVCESENTEKQRSDNENNDNFLKFKKCVPTADCSPSVPILKRKLADVVDEATISPASKRKRVSFHDPPVSTTIAVQKYIEPGVHSPQSSAHKRLDKQMRATTKPPKKLENVFKLETVLNKAVERFSEEVTVSIDDTVNSFDQTPAVEVVKTCELNDTDPICSDLLDCADPIDNIAGELSSPAMKALFIKELEGTVKTIGDLAKMTELEVNRLRIKAPKVKVAKKVLNDYASKKAKEQSELTSIEDEFKLDMAETISVSQQTASVEVQTNPVFTSSCDMQTVTVPVMVVHTQTDTVPTSHTDVQTDESGNKSTHDVIATCLLEKPDFIDQLGKQLEESSVQRIANNLSVNAIVDLLLNKMTTSDTMSVLDQVLNKQIANDPLRENSINKSLQTYLCQRFQFNDLILFCSQLLQKIHEKIP